MRESKISRKTNETEIEVEIKIDGTGSYQIDTGIGFFNHVLELFAFHGLFDLKIEAKSDLKVDNHHTVEDVGIVLGQAFSKALGERNGIKRYGTFYVPMDETLVMVSLDISSRPFLHFNVILPSERVGDFETECLEEFLRAFVNNFGITLHISLLHGKNTHHIIEAVFKAFARALREALTIDERYKNVPSTKGIL